MTTFEECFDADYNARRNYNGYGESLGYYQDNGITRWEPLTTVDVEQELRFAPGAMAVGEFDNYDLWDCEEF